jgi:uncharacterized membrane protein YccC
MATSARPSTTAAAGPTAPVVVAGETLGFRLPDWLDPVSAQIALKTAVGVVIAQTVALWMDWNPTGATLAVLMLQQTYFGRTLARSILRMIGALIGSVVGLFVLHLLVQERALFILVVALLIGGVIYLQQGSRHPYAWLFCGFSVMLLTFGSATQPEGAFAAAVGWVSGNALGITIVLVMHGVLWPHTGEGQFDAQLRTMLRDSARLFALKVSGPLQGRPLPREIGRIESGLIQAMPQLRLALQIAGRETGRVAALRPDYELLIEEAQALVTLVITLGESLKNCAESPTVMAAIGQSGAVHELAATLEAEVQGLVDDLELDRIGTQVEPHTAALTRVRALTDDLFDALRARPHDAMDVAVLAAALAKTIELASRVAAIRETLALRAQPHGTEVARQQLRALARRPVYLGLASDRWRKAAAASLVVGVSAVLWIVTNWPAPGKLILFAFAPAALGALVPQFSMKALLKSLIYGPAIAAVLYFGIMPSLADMWQLAPFLIIALFPCAYFVNSANPSTSITGMMSGIWILELIDLSQGQIYPFSGFAENLVGIVGAVLVAVIVISLLLAPIPEQRFRAHVRGFFAICAETARRAAAFAPGDPKAEISLRAGRSRMAEQLRTCHMWWEQLDRDRFSDDERQKAAFLTAAMRSLTFRQDALEQARLELPADRLSRQLAESEEELRRLRILAYRKFEHAAARCEPAPAPDIAALVGPYQILLAAIRDVRERRDEDAEELARAILVLMGLRQALAQAINDCYERFNALNWQTWGAAHF